jgi:hypothetical protein
MNLLHLEKLLCSTFCGGISVNPVGAGYAISTAFEDDSGDPITFYLVNASDSFRIEDDGSYLSQLIAMDVPIDQGQRGQLLESILDSGGAYWDHDTYEIKTGEFDESEIPARVIKFLSSMIRVRDLELITREVIRSTFKEDAANAIEKAFGHDARFESDVPVSRDLGDFPADFVILPKRETQSVKHGAVFFVNSNERLSEALLHQFEVREKGNDKIETIALIEDPALRVISLKKFQRAQNRDLAMPIFRQDEDAAMDYMRRRLGYHSRRAAGIVSHD